MFICDACPELVVRRIEHKLGIHGVATCELQYNHVPAELCGLRKRGLTRYVMALMNGARVAISGQALGIAEAAYRAARKYASEREQFKVSIDKFPAVFDMLTKMKLKVTAARTLLYETTRIVDLRNGYGHLMDHTPPEQLTDDIRKNDKLYTKLAAILTPMSKAYSTEIANQVAYDSIQIHGGTGYMHDFDAERYYRDARITNIYEGTTQLQHVAAIGGVIQRNLDVLTNIYAAIPQEGLLLRLKGILDDMHARQKKVVEFITAKKYSTYNDQMAKYMVDMETFIFVGYLMIRDAKKSAEREALAERFVIDASHDFDRCYSIVMSGDFTVIDKHRSIIDY
jgi:hypothetical protein